MSIYKKYISDAGIENLKSYEYHGIDFSICATYVMQHFWRRAVNWLPMWLAPNLVTLIGFIHMLAAFSVLGWYCPTLTEEAPRYVYLFCGLCMFIYQTMDALDGKQARRTGTSSPLGELFDHGCDALNTMSTCISLSMALQLGTGTALWLMCAITYLAFYYAQWEEYHTQRLDLALISVTEAQLSYMSIMVTTFFLGPSFWSNSIQIFGFAAQYKYLLVALGTVCSIGTIVNNVVRVHVLPLETLRKSQGHRVVLGFVPIYYVRMFSGLFFTGLSALWAFTSDVMDRHPQAFHILFGFIMAYSVGHVILARMTRDKYPLFNLALYPLPVVVLNSFVQLVPETPLLYAYTAFSVALYFYFALCVIDQLCTILDIWALSIKYHKRP